MYAILAVCLLGPVDYSMLAGKPVDYAGLAACEPAAPLTYAAAYAQSLETGKTLIVWVGGNFCERCVNETDGEFLHCFVDAFDGATSPSLVVLAPSAGTLWRIADITQWVEGDLEHGHMPTTRKAIARWKATGLATDQRALSAYARGPMMRMGGYQQARSRGRMMSRGGC